MVLRGQRKLLLMLTALLAPCVVSAGCQSRSGPMAPAFTGGGASCSSCQNSTGYRPGGQLPPYTQVPGQPPGNFLPGDPRGSTNGAVQPVSYNQPNGVTPLESAPPPGMLGSPVGPDSVVAIDGMPVQGNGPCPNEMQRVSHPPYTISPPDILVIDAVRLIPRPPYRVEPLEVLLLQVSGTLPNQPIAGPFTVGPDGTINLGFGYGSLRVAGLTLEQIQLAIRNHLTNQVQNPQVSVALAQFRGMQQTRGEHLVRQDGTISLGTYGCVYVAGLTLGQAKYVIEQYLSKWLLNPEISIDVAAYNSKVYYVIFDGGGYGQQVYRFPITGNETVLDAIAMVQGLPPVASKHRIWLARPSPDSLGCDQVLPVDWNAITQGGQTRTNYQIFPGDRLYVSADRLIALDLWMAKIFAPIERVLGITLLGTSVSSSFRNNGNGNGAFVGVVGR